MDYNDHEHLTKEIDKLYQDQRQITHLIENSTPIIQSEISNIRENEKENSSNMRFLENQISVLLQRNQQALNQISKFEYLEAISRIGRELERVAEKYLNSLCQMIQAINHAKHGKLDPYLINNEQIVKTANEIEKSLTESIFPVTKQKLDLAIISQISKITTGINNGRFIVTVKIPLLPRDHFDLFKMIPCRVPQVIEGNKKITVAIKPKKDYIMLSKSNFQYALINKDYLQECIPLENCLACYRGIPILKAKNNDQCEYNLLTNNDLQPTTELLQNCDIRMFNQIETFWTQLNSKEGWLFSTTNPERMEINCHGQLSEIITLQGTGVLQLNKNCSSQTSSIILEGTETIISELPSIQGVSITINLTEIAPILTKTPEIPSLLTNLKHDFLPNYTNTDIFGKSMQETIEKVKEIGLHHQEQYYHKIFSLTNCSITGVLITIFGIGSFFLFKFGINPCSILKCCRRRKKNMENKFSRRVPIRKSQIERDYEIPISTMTLVPTQPGPPMPIRTTITSLDKNLKELPQGNSLKAGIKVGFAPQY